MFEDFEFDLTALGLTVILSGIFIGMVWLMPTWTDYATRNKIIITILLPVVSYFIIASKLNN